MQVILLDKINRLGNLGDVVKVKDGFARNFLIPQGHARRATPAAIKEFEVRRAELERASADRRTAAQAVCAKIHGTTIIIKQKAGVDGRLFGSVTNHDITQALHEQGLNEVSKSQVRMPNGPLKAVGEYAVVVALHTDAIADLNVTIVADND